MNLSGQLSSEEDETSALSPFFESIISTLLHITESNSNEANSRTSAYEAMATLAANSAKDTLPIVAKMAVTVMDRLELSLLMLPQCIGLDDRLQMAELLSNLLGVLASVVRVTRRNISEVSDRAMQLLIQTLEATGKHSSVAEDVFLVVSALVISIEHDFARYVDSFVPYLYAALSNYEEYQLNAIAVGLIGDLSRALSADIAKYLDSFMPTLLLNIESDSLNRDVKPAILSCFGDLAMAVGDAFASYLDLVLQVLASACNMSAKLVPTDYDLADFNNRLRCSIFEAYIGLVQGLKPFPSLINPHLSPQLPGLFTFMEIVANDFSNRSEDITLNILGLLGDVADAFPPQSIAPLLSSPWVSAIIRHGRSTTKGGSVRETARWAREMIRRVTS